MDFRKQTLSGLGWSGTSQVARQVITFVISIILARLLSPKEFGLIGMIAVFTGFAQIFTDMGLGSALIQKADLEARHLNAVFWANLAVGFALTVIVVATGPLIASFYDTPILQSLTMVISLNFLLGSLNVVQNALIHKKMEFRKLAIIENVAVLVSGFLAISMALAGMGVWSLVAQSLLLTAISMLMMWLFSTWRPIFSIEWAALKELLGYSSNLLGFNIFNYWVRNLDNVLIGRFIGTSALGIYTRGYSLMLLPISQISSVITRVMFPALSVIQNDPEKVKSIYLRSTKILALVTFPIMIGLLVVTKPFVLTVFGDKWAGVIPILQVLCLTGMGQSIGTTVGWIYTSQGRTDLMFRWGIFAGLVYAVAIVIGLRWGVIGVAWAYALSGYLIVWYPSWAIPGRLINLSFMEMMKNLASPFYCALAMGITVRTLGFLLPTNWPQWTYLVVQVPFGIIVYISLIHFFKLRAYVETLELVKEQWQKQFKTRFATFSTMK